MRFFVSIIKSVSFLIALAFLLAASVSCTKSAPIITYGFLNLVLYQGDDGPQEHFSFFVIPEDEDGIENLDSLYLYHDREQLRWQIKSDDWVKFSSEGKDWIGTRSISAPEGGLPRGLFRAVLVNKGGESSERTFTYDGNARFPFPEIEISNGMYTINSQWTVNRLVCYDNSGNYLSTVNVDSLSGNVSQLRLPSSAGTVALWAEDEANFCSAFTNVVPIN
ncbi:MAG: hypothetical protein LBI28_12450 [Treponema sp.]|jgi:hypothetical protein|nr:hypothetical protein [Treponema sp.]